MTSYYIVSYFSVYERAVSTRMYFFIFISCSVFHNNRRCNTTTTSTWVKEQKRCCCLTNNYFVCIVVIINYYLSLSFIIIIVINMTSFFLVVASFFLLLFIIVVIGVVVVDLLWLILGACSVAIASNANTKLHHFSNKKRTFWERRGSAAKNDSRVTIYQESSKAIEHAQNRYRHRSKIWPSPQQCFGT